MRLYLSSFRTGNRADQLVRLLPASRRTALILNADDYKSAEDRRDSLRRETEELRGVGLDPEELDLRDFFSRPEETRSVIASFDAVYVRGGNVFLLRRALHQSGADAAIKGLLAEDAIVYAGYSAGPCVLGPTLRGIEGYEDDPYLAPRGYQRDVIWEGLAVLPYMVLPHYDAEAAGIGRLLRFYIENHVPFVALRDGEALVINGAGRHVIG